MFSRDDLLKILRHAEIRLLNEVINTNNSNLVLKIRKELSNLKNIMIRLIGNVIKLRKMVINGIGKDKFNTDKMDNHYMLDFSFILKLNQSLQFLREGPIGKRFNLKSKFDPLLLDFEYKNGINEKALMKYSYSLLNEMAAHNLFLSKNQPSASSIRSTQMKKPQSKTIIKANNNSNGLNANNSNKNCSIQLLKNKEKQNKIDSEFNNNANNSNGNCNNNEDKQMRRNKKEMIECKETNIKNDCDIDMNKNNSTKQLMRLNIKEVGDDYIKGLEEGDEIKGEHTTFDKDQSQTHESYIDFYIEPFDIFKQLYKEYYNQIPSLQLTVFNLKEDLEKLTEGINPLIIVQYTQRKMSSLCLIATDAENYNSLNINHFSSNNTDLKDSFNQIIAFIQSNICFKEITIDLYHEIIDGKLQLRKEMNSLFKSINFRWSKLENLEDGTRFQSMKFINPNHQTTLGQLHPPLEIKSGMIGYVSKNYQDDNTPSNQLNMINKAMINAQIHQSDTVNEIKESFNFIKEFKGNEEETNAFLIKKGYSNLNQFTLPPQDNNSSLQLYSSCFELFPLFNSFISKQINQYVYNRIKVNKEVFYEKETNQFFNIIQQESYLILIGEMTPQFNQFITSSNDIYEAFNHLYSQFEEMQKDITFLWIPSFSLSNHTQSLTETESNITYSSITNVRLHPCAYKHKTINLAYSERDVIISKAFFISIININQSSAVNNQIVFCSIVNSIEWELNV